MEFLLNPQKGLWNITVGNPSSEFHTENRHKTSQDNFAKEEHPPPPKKSLICFTWSEYMTTWGRNCSSVVHSAC